MRQAHLRDVISSRSLIPYLAWRAGINGRGQTQVRLTTGEKLILRPAPTDDLGNAMEVFLFQIYQSPKPLPNLRRIVDLGANVGFSVVYFAHRFRDAEVIAWEPHPDHIRQLRANVEVNGLSNRVSIHPYAAGSKNEVKWLVDQGTRSHVVDEFQPSSVRIELKDWLGQVGTEAIDLLKVDIEGGEYDLFLDERFAALKATRIVVECHCGRQRPRGDVEIAERLKAIGYELYAGHTTTVCDMRVAMLWAFRP